MTAHSQFDVDDDLKVVRRRRPVPTRWLVAGVVLAGAATLAAVEYDKRFGAVQSTADAMLQADTVPIVSRVAGRVAELTVRDNDPVPAGGPLMTIVADGMDERLRAATGELEGIRAGLITNQAEIAAAASAVRQARAQYDAGRAEYRRIAAEVRRYRPLVAQGAEPAEKLSQLSAEQDRAAAQIASLQASLSAAQARFAGSRSQISEIQARGSIARAGRDAVLNDRQNGQVLAPVGGRIAALTAREGQYVQAGQRLGTVVPIDQMYVVANFKETQIASLRPGQPARVYLDALPDQEIAGQVESLSPGTKASTAIIPAQNASGNFTKIVQRVPVRIRIDTPPGLRGLMVNGLSASVEIDTSAPVRGNGR